MTKLLIGPYETGLQRNVEPWLLPNEAFKEIEDAYVWRGKVKRKNGYRLLQRLALTPTLPEAKANVLAGAVTYTATSTNAFVSPGTLQITITYGGGFVFSDNGNGTLTATTLPVGINYGWGTINYLTGVFVLNWDTALAGPGPYAVNITAYRYWPISASQRLPCMGLYQYERPAINREDTIAFDRFYSYLYNSGTGLFDVLTDPALNRALWSSSNSEFFWAVNYFFESGTNYLFWATNGVFNTNAGGFAINGIMIYNGTFWYSQTPQVNATPTYLRGCLLLVPYRNRMVALNTWEGANIGGANPIQIPNRARWSQNGVPYVSGLAGSVANAWRDDIPGLGGYIDAPTNEMIISARFYKDTLVVFFERSTWELRYTGNEILPFIWYRINTDFGCESTFSTIPFDDGILAVGDKRITTATSIQVQPIDTKIPNLVFDIENENNGVTRVHGIRDYYKKFAYWTIPTAVRDGIYPDKVLALNYDEGSFSLFNDTFTCFGYHQNATDYTWATIPWIWEEWVLPWGSPQAQAWFPSIAAGTQLGNIVILDDQSNNAPVIDLLRNGLAGIPAITNANPAVFFCPNHNLSGSFSSVTNYYDGDYLKPFYVSGFGINVVGELFTSLATAGSVSFTGTFGNLVTPWCGYIILSAVITIGALNYIDLGDGTLIETTGTLNTGTINYESRTITVNYAALAVDTPVTISYTYNVLNYRTFTVNSLTANTFTLFSIRDDGSMEPLDLSAFAAYDDWAVLQMINNFYVNTKTFSPFLQQDQGVRLNYLDLYTSSAPGTISLNFYVGESYSQIAQTLNFELFKTMNTSLIPPQPEINTIVPDKFWKRAFPSLVSDFVEIEMQMSSVQMRDRVNYNSLFEMHAMILDVAASGRLIGYS